MRILIEPTAIMHVLGTKMDFVEDRLKCALPRHVPRLFTALYVCCASCSMATPTRCLPGMLLSSGSGHQPTQALKDAVPECVYHSRTSSLLSAE